MPLIMQHKSPFLKVIVKFCFSYSVGSRLFSALHNHEAFCASSWKRVYRRLRRVEAVDLLGEVGEADGFRYKKGALIYEHPADVVDTELIRERVCRHLSSRRQRSPG